MNLKIFPELQDVKKGDDPSSDSPKPYREELPEEAAVAKDASVGQEDSPVADNMEEYDESVELSEADGCGETPYPEDSDDNTDNRLAPDTVPSSDDTQTESVETCIKPDGTIESEVNDMQDGEKENSNTLQIDVKDKSQQEVPEQYSNVNKTEKYNPSEESTSFVVKTDMLTPTLSVTSNVTPLDANKQISKDDVQENTTCDKEFVEEIRKSEAGVEEKVDDVEGSASEPAEKGKQTEDVKFTEGDQNEEEEEFMDTHDNIQSDET